MRRDWLSVGRYLALYPAPDVASYIRPMDHLSATRQQALESDERYGAFDAYKAGRLYNHNARSNDTGGDDYWESGVANPHLVLADLIKIFHPDLLAEHTLHYYRRLP